MQITSCFPLPQIATDPVSGGPPFAEMLEKAIEHTQTLQTEAQTKATQALVGGEVDVHDAVIAMQKAELTFQLALQVRNKVVAAYEEISKLQF